MPLWSSLAWSACVTTDVNVASAASNCPSPVWAIPLSSRVAASTIPPLLDEACEVHVNKSGQRRVRKNIVAPMNRCICACAGSTVRSTPSRIFSAWS